MGDSSLCSIPQTTYTSTCISTFHTNSTMNTFSTALLVTMSLSYLVCDGAIWDCNGRQEGSHMSWHGADKCANEGGNEYCTGPGRIYYGDGLTWTYKDLGEGQRVGCNNGAFGCDPLPLFPKKCYNSCDLFHECAKTGEVALNLREYATESLSSCDLSLYSFSCSCCTVMVDPSP